MATEKKISRFSDLAKLLCDTHGELASGVEGMRQRNGASPLAPFIYTIF
jgi:hypothetical protein